MKKQLTIAALLLAAFTMTTGCKKDEKTPDDATTTATPTTSTYDVPKTYNGFSSVDHNESTTIIGMTTELGTEINKGAGTTGNAPVPLNKTHLLNLLKNQGGAFSNATYNTSGYQIEGNCVASSVAELENFIDSLVKVSNASGLASSGVAGLGLTKDATPKRYLLTSNGVNYAQIVNKSLMCDLVLNQIVNRVINTGLDNSTLITSGDKQYTAMEHNWDVAFGYWSVPDSFPTVKTPVKLWGSYSNQVDSGLHCNRAVMNAFLKGRAAIHNKDMETAQAQANIIATQFDVMTAGAVCQELNEIKASFAANDQIKVVSQLSELRGFVMSMYNNKTSKRVITDTQIAALLNLIPTNHWNVTATDLSNIGNYIAGIYGFTAAQMAVL